MQRTESFTSLRKIVSSLATLGCAVLLLQVADLALPNGMPTKSSPLPLFTFIVILGFGILGAVLIPILFCIWGIHLFRGEVCIPKRSLFAFKTITTLNAVYLIASWRYGLKYQGQDYLLTMYIINGMFVLALSGLAIGGHRKPNFIVNLLFHFILFTWLLWYAFPHLGELA